MNTAIRNHTPDSVIAESKSDPTKSKWSSAEMMLAVVIDEVRQLQWMYAQAHSDKRIPRPDPIPRPGLPKRVTRAIPLAEAQKLDPRLRGLSDEEAQDMLDKFTGRRRSGDN